MKLMIPSGIGALIYSSTFFCPRRCHVMAEELVEDGYDAK